MLPLWLPTFMVKLSPSISKKYCSKLVRVTLVSSSKSARVIGPAVALNSGLSLTGVISTVKFLSGVWVPSVALSTTVLFPVAFATGVKVNVLPLRLGTTMLVLPASIIPNVMVALSGSETIGPRSIVWAPESSA